MQLTITQIHTTPQTITITQKEYNQLRHKATEYDKIITTRSTHMRTYNNNLTPQQRSDKARQAAFKRWHKVDNE